MSWRVIATLVLIAWGALAFGAVYPWGFAPLFAGGALVGAAGFFRRRGAGTTDVVLAASLALVAVAIGLQLWPLSVETIRWLSPETDAFLRRYAIGYAISVQNHPLSIQPRATMLALAAATALSVFFLGLARALTHDDTRALVRGVSVIGIALTIAGVVQKAMWNGKIYGFWTPRGAGDSFGPFVNRNHFAGWMLMAMPLVAGYFLGRVARGMRGVKPGFRNRLVWLSSRDASESTLLGFAALLMALGLTLTMSRSGILGLFAALIVSGWVVARRQAGRSRRAMMTGYLLFVAVVAVGWTGLDRIAARFAEGRVVTVDGRLGVWADTWRMAERFPLTGMGLDTFGTATLYYQTADLKEHFAEAHNDYLQLLAEGGALVCIPAGLAILAFARTVRRRLRDVPRESTEYGLRIGALTGILAIAMQEMADFSLQIPGNAALFVVLMALVIRPSTRRRPVSMSDAGA